MADSHKTATRFPEIPFPGTSGPSDADWEIQPSPIAGLGLFARRPFQVEDHVLEYVGEVISQTQSLERRALGNHFIFRLDEDRDLDGNVAWNPARLANHSCDPNCEARCLEGRVWLIAMRAIASGAELTFDYGYDLDDYREHPCHCGAKGCVGYIVAESLRGWLRKDINHP